MFSTSRSKRPGPTSPTVCPRASATPESDLSARLIAWYEANRRALPWRKTRDPYAIWISETMLQQTQVATVIPYWERWLARFPTPTALADAPLEDVLKHWQGLGYYARARNLHKAARQIRDRHRGTFPTSYDDVLALPGVGRYTAGAICSIALGQDRPIVDANVIRVLTRLFAIEGDPRSPAVQEALWKKAEELIPPGQAGTFNQAMMELGALVCGSPPECQRCPLSDSCQAHRRQETARFPELAPKKALALRRDVCAAIFDDAGRLLLTRRAPGGLWGGLWELPRATAAESESDGEAAIRAAREIAGLGAAPGAERARVRHGVMHFRVTLLAIECATTRPEEAHAAGCAEIAWLSPEEALRLPLPSPQARLIEQLRESTPQLALFH